MAKGDAVLSVGYYDVGYDDANSTAAGHLIIRNSWGTDWGASGYAHLPFSYIAANAEGVSPLARRSFVGGTLPAVVRRSCGTVVALFNDPEQIDPWCVHFQYERRTEWSSSIQEHAYENVI